MLSHYHLFLKSEMARETAEHAGEDITLSVDREGGGDARGGPQGAGQEDERGVPPSRRPER